VLYTAVRPRSLSLSSPIQVPTIGHDLHVAQLMPLPLTVSCFSKIQIGFTFLIPAHLGGPGQTAVKRVCVKLPVRHLLNDQTTAT